MLVRKMHSYGGSGETSGRSRNRGTPSPYSNESSSLLLPDGSSSEDELAGMIILKALWVVILV